MKQSLKDRLLAYINKLDKPIASGELQRLVMEKTSYTPRTTVRRLEELAEEGLLEVSYKKGHAYYKAKEVSPLEAMEEWFERLPTKRPTI